MEALLSEDDDQILQRYNNSSISNTFSSTVSADQNKSIVSHQLNKDILQRLRDHLSSIHAAVPSSLSDIMSLKKDMVDGHQNPFIYHDLVQVGLVSEVFGQCGTGKTQMCLTVAAETVLKYSPHCAVYYIDTCNGFHINRFLEILQSIKTKNQSNHINQHGYNNNSSNSHQQQEEEYDDDQINLDLISNVHCLKAFDALELLEALEQLLESSIYQLEQKQQNPSYPSSSFSLLIIDSLASIMTPVLLPSKTGGNDNSAIGNFKAGRNILLSIGNMLNRLAGDARFAILVTNYSVNAHPKDLSGKGGLPMTHASSASSFLGSASNHIGIDSSLSNEKAGLGKIWRHYPSIQIHLSQSYIDGTRMMLVTKYPSLICQDSKRKGESSNSNINNKRVTNMNGHLPFMIDTHGLTIAI